MDRIWQWAWDRRGTRYSWVVYAVAMLLSLPPFLFWSFLIVAVEQSGAYVEAAVVIIVTLPVLGYLNMLPGLGSSRRVEQWVAGDDLDRAVALSATYAWTRGVALRMPIDNGIWGGLVSVVIAAIAGATGWEFVQYGVLGAAVGTALGLGGVHNLVEAAVRPARVAIAGDTGIGDSLPRSRPTFATWSNVFVLTVVFVCVVDGAMLAVALSRSSVQPIVFLAIGCLFTLVFGVPFTVGLSLAPSLQPIRDLAKGTERVAAGDSSRRLPVFQDDDRRRRSTACRRVWLSGNGFRRYLVPTSTRVWRHVCSSRATTCSAASAVR